MSEIIECLIHEKISRNEQFSLTKLWKK